MRLLRAAAILSFVIGIGAMSYGLLFTGGDPPKPAFFDVTPLPEDTATPLPTDVPPTPTPKPFDGAVGRVKIPRLGIDYPATDLGVLPDGHLDTPHGGDAVTKIG